MLPIVSSLGAKSLAHLALSFYIFHKIVLNWECAGGIVNGRPTVVPYSGTLDLRDIHTVLVARNLKFTKTGKLRFKSVRALAPFQDQLFRFER